MTKKDYIKLASALKDAREVGELCKNGVVEGITMATFKIARVLREDNPRFDVERFLEACGVPQEEWNL